MQIKVTYEFVYDIPDGEDRALAYNSTDIRECAVIDCDLDLHSLLNEKDTIHIGVTNVVPYESEDDNLEMRHQIRMEAADLVQEIDDL